MRRFLAPMLLCLGAACDTGTPAYMGLAPQRVQIGEMVYDVRVNGLMAEALRQNMMLTSGTREIALSAAAAMRQVTGCEVLQLRGDPSIVEGRLICDGEEAPAFSRQRRTRVFLCTFERMTIKPPETVEDYQAFCV